MRYNILLALVAFVLIGFSSCVPDGENLDLLANGEDGAIPFITDEVGGFYDLVDIANATTGFKVNSSATGSTVVNSITVMKSLNGGTAVEHATISGTEGAVTIPVSEAVSGLGVTTSDLALGDVFTFSFKLNTTDGRAIGSGVTVNVPMSCVSSIGGDYTAVSEGTSTDGCCPGTYNVTSTVTLTDAGGGKYTVSDWSGGLYYEWYSIYGITTTNSPGEILDVCNELTLLTTTEPFGESLTGTWTRDASTGVITVAWSNGWGDQGTSVLTPL